MTQYEIIKNVFVELSYPALNNRITHKTKKLDDIDRWNKIAANDRNSQITIVTLQKVINGDHNLTSEQEILLWDTGIYNIKRNTWIGKRYKINE